MAGPTTEQELLELLQSPGGLRDQLASAMADAFKMSISPLVKSQIDTILAEQEKRYDAKLDGLLRGAGLKRLPMGGAAHNPLAPGASLDGEWRHAGDYLIALNNASRGLGRDARLKVLSESDAGAGGYLVPEEYRAQLLALSLEDAIVRPRATVLPMPGEMVKFPAIRDTSHASSVFGGVVAYWTPESGSVTAAEPTFTQLALIAKKLTGYTTASNELMADSAIALEALIQRLFPQAIQWYEEGAFFQGTGVGQPLGMVSAPCRVTVSKETGQKATTLVTENLDKMYARMLPSSKNKAVWIANNDVFPQLAALARNVGTGGAPVFISNVAGAPPTSIYNRPVFYTEHLPTIGTEGDIIFVDLSYYLIGDRQALTMSASPHVRFTNDETVWKFVERLDGRPWLEAPLTPQYGTNTLSPIVTVATRA